MKNSPTIPTDLSTFDDNQLAQVTGGGGCAPPPRNPSHGCSPHHAPPWRPWSPAPWQRPWPMPWQPSWQQPAPKGPCGR